MNVDELDYEQIVALHHADLYRFAFSLASNPDDAAELTQETYVRLLNKSWQLRDPARVKSWLFTTLYRTFLGWKRRENRFPHFEVLSVESELPPLMPEVANGMDGETAMDSVLDLEEHFRAPLVLYYLQCLTYREIAEVLDVPIGTVMSRMSRGKELLRQRLQVKKLRQTQPANCAPPGASIQSNVAIV
jgi:RNA polymerase sigma-70 factor (ECF subfamily)